MSRVSARVAARGLSSSSSSDVAVAAASSSTAEEARKRRHGAIDGKASCTAPTATRATHRSPKDCSKLLVQKATKEACTEMSRKEGTSLKGN